MNAVFNNMSDRYRVPTLTGITTAILFAFATPAKALKVDIMPKTPVQGDTISVIIETEDASISPTVTINEVDYPVFPHDGKYRAFVPTSPLNVPGKMTLQVKGDDRVSNIGVWLKNRYFPVQRIWLSGKASRPATQLELNRVREFKELVTPQKYWQGSFIRPNASRVSTGFGLRRYYNGVFANSYYHKGVDYAGGYGSPVVSPAGGVVRLVGREQDGFHVHGNTIGIDHGQGVLSVFLHLQDINVAEGTTVKPGQRIGTIGSTGASTGPHLHWGLYVNQVAVDPVPWRFGKID
ncbi:MAG: M23 family metallopeptidase [Cyanobacteria bacterium P01_G01_bin.19]